MNEPTAGAPATPGAPAKPRLLDQVSHAIRVRHYSRRTEEAYVGWIRRFILFHGKRHPATMGEPEITRFLSWLAVERKVGAITQNQALSAILFLYREVLRQEIGWLQNVARAKGPRRLPVVLSREEVRAVLQHLDGPVWLVAALLYGSGLRLLEALHLRIKDIDFGDNQITVRSGKGGKDRVTMLPAIVKEPLARHLEVMRLQHQQDLERNAGWVEMPLALARKYPSAGREWCWQWAFPATRSYRDAATRECRRHHLHESVIQRAVHAAIRSAGIRKHASCHTFRHYADLRIMPSPPVLFPSTS